MYLCACIASSYTDRLEVGVGLFGTGVKGIWKLEVPIPTTLKVLNHSKVISKSKSHTNFFFVQNFPDSPSESYT